MDIAVAGTWPSHHRYSVKTCLLKTDGPSRLSRNSRAAMHDLSRDCRSEFSRVPQDPFWARKRRPDFAVSYSGSLTFGSLRIALPDKGSAAWEADSAGTRQCRGLHWWALELAPAGCSAKNTPKSIAGCSVDTWSSSRFLIFFSVNKFTLY